MTWFKEWLSAHLRRHAQLGLPSPADNFEMYDAWRLEFLRFKIDKAAATDASISLASKPVAKANHFPALVKLALKARDYQNRSAPEAAAPVVRFEETDPPDIVELDYTYLLPPGYLRDLADKLRPPGRPRAPDPRESR